jgi:DNA-binding LacI/PurR family transcriptional regulator
VSLALRDDPRITPETTSRVKAHAAKRGYFADPVVAEGMSRVRRRSFYRETVIWLLDQAKEEQWWLKKMFGAVTERGRVLGYEIEYCTVDFKNAAKLKRLARTWQARGIRGVLIGPLNHAVADPALPWHDFSWVAIGQSLTSPALHRAGRDYDKDIEFALSRLHAQGCKRPGFVDDTTMHHLMGLPLLRMALVYYHQRGLSFAEPLYTADLRKAAAFKRWLEANRPDSLVLGMSFEFRAPEFHRLVEHLPQVELTHSNHPQSTKRGFVRNYTGIGNAAIGLLHHLLADGEKGVPDYEQSLVVSSRWQDGIQFEV